MRLKLKYRVEGLQESIQAFEAMSKATSRNVLRRALIKSVQPIADAAARLAPRDTGRLAKSIAIATTLKKYQRREHKKRSPVEVFVGSTSSRAHLLEFGTVKMAAQPFLRPAVDANLQRSIDLFNSELKTEIDEAAKRQARKAAKRIAQIRSAK